MYDFRYNYIKARYGAHAQLLFTDTDSLIYRIETEDLYNDMKTESDRFDFSTYPRTHFRFWNKNEKIIGKIKDENNGVAQLEFVGSKSKMYSITDGKHEKKTAKGVNRYVTERELMHADIEIVFPMRHRYLRAWTEFKAKVTNCILYIWGGSRFAHFCW